MVYSGILREKKKIIYVQTIQIGLLVISNLVLGGITGAIINALSFIRNVLCYKDKLGTNEKIVIIILSLIFNNLGFIGILPVISTVPYILLMNTKNVIKFKILNINSYTSAIFDFISIVANIILIFQLRVKNK